MNTQEKLDAAQQEFDRLTGQINSLPPGPVRVGIKNKRNNLTGNMVRLRQQLIKEQIESESPQDVPRLRFLGK